MSNNKNKPTDPTYLLFFTILPALLLGTYIMAYFDVPRSLWMMHLGFGLVGIGLQWVFLRFRPVFKKAKPYPILLVTIVLLLLTFFDDGYQDVHRWISIGSFSLNIGLMVSPLILIQIHKIQNQTFATLVSLLAVLIFLFQPDTSLVTAFSVSAAIILFRKNCSKTTKGLILISTIGASVFAWYNLDNLPPVDYVEGILALAWQISVFFGISSVVSLVLLPLPFFILANKENRTMAYSLGLYFSLIFLATLFGNFPVMVMGYGISPIVGYFIGLYWLGKGVPRSK
jgi:cell division protein FtsW (lipid II flippase)